MLNRDQNNSLLASCLVHAVVFLGAGGAILQPARYEVEAGAGGLEVSLIAAPLPPAGEAAVPSAPAGLQEPEAAPASDGTRDPLPVPPHDSPSGPVNESEGLREPSPHAGDGSSPVAGADPTTLYVSGGALSGAGGRLKNPAPPYPSAAIQRRQEGLVTLEAAIDASGRPVSVEVVHSSGFELLDQSALRTVRRWRFDPAHLGFLPVQSRLVIPIRFVLDGRVSREPF